MKSGGGQNFFQKSEKQKKLNKIKIKYKKESLMEKIFFSFR